MTGTPQHNSGSGVAAVVGTFDGVHLGHRYLLDRLTAVAAADGLSTRVYTFTGHPLESIDPAHAPGRLTTPAAKERKLREAGIDDVVTDDFARIRHLTAHQYICRLASEGVRLLLVGHDNRFGSDGLHTLDEFRDAARGTNVEIIQAPELTGPEGNSISSSAIRALIAAGRVGEAAQLLGRPYSLAGTVEHGKHLGHTIGFPTANLRPDDPAQLIPERGVYAARAITPCGTFPAMLNIGSRPTVDRPGAPSTIEAHIIGFDGDIYGRHLTLEFLRRLRPEKRFDGIEPLRRQLEADREATLDIFRQ